MFLIHSVSRRVVLVATLLVALAGVGARPSPAHAQDGGVAATYRGSGKAVYGPVGLHAGLAILRGRSNGAANFVAYLVKPNPGEDVTQSYGNRYLLIDAVGRFDGAGADLLREGGDYFVEVSQASGAYELSVEQPDPANVAVTDRRGFSGRGPQVTPAFALPAGSYTVNAQSDSSALRVWLYRLDDLGGGAVVSALTGYYGSELIDTTIPPGYTGVPVDLPDDGVYILFVAPGGSGSGAWQVSVD